VPKTTNNSDLKTVESEITVQGHQQKVRTQRPKVIRVVNSPKKVPVHSNLMLIQ